MTKHWATFIAGVALSAWAIAQAPAQTTQPGAAGANTAQSSGRPPIQARNQAEFEAFQTAAANAQNTAAMEKAADDFAGKFPDSQLRVLLYRTAMHSYQTAGNSAKMMEMGLKV